MVEWKQVELDLAEEGYSDFEFDRGETAVPGVSGSWLVGRIKREGRLKRENHPFRWKVLDSLPFGTTLPTDPEYAPDSVRQIAEKYGLDVVIISGGRDWVRIALVEADSEEKRQLGRNL
ncbi:hypothetical protein [Halalkalicoccus jeotgali]|uniref:Uncharacterized protein n=1 Tax=Halalkalicoccus jeotgali (strain DSM 18796 / CECT 7217 / JCM 14584 / KCTC 4019 / B3) TaxID=795797 RepID=D8J3F0_HALJB|nr:hypothetical protein [Halalkalicoccus jeotgali]ADJ15257.1 hypothetical protein HacjB3_09370 [Halalkalicoccus jeotgali B3]ELY35322.1 hypothetical protein C497_13306 [Halalkalicoccus jeotgali B3]